jgi:hypothetical protein
MMRRALLEHALDRACGPSGARFAAILPRLARTVPATPAGARLVRELCADPRWAARHLAGRSLPRLVPAAMPLDEAWERLIALAADEEALVREAAPHGLGELALASPEAAGRLERLIEDAGAPRLARRAAVRSLIVVVPVDEQLAARLLRTAALAGDGAGRGVGAVVLGRGLGARDPGWARRLAEEWAASDEPVLREQARRALRGPLADAGDGAEARRVAAP